MTRVPEHPDPLREQRARIAANRAEAGRQLARSRRWRRRIPPLLVAAGTLAGSGAAAVWVQSRLPAGTAPTAYSANTSAAAAQLAGQEHTLLAIARALAADQRSISAIRNMPRLAGDDGSAAAGAGGAAGIPTLPSLPSLPSVNVGAPPVSAVTGASGVVVP